MSRMQLSLQGDDADEFRQIRDEIGNEIGFELSNADTLRYLMSNCDVQ